MYIIIVGLGKVGQLITDYLAKEGHDIVVVDQNQKKVEQVVHQFDVLGLVGNGANYDILKEAGAYKADAVIAVTTSDELNILSGMICKQMGTQHSIARVRNPDYSHQKDFLRDKLGISMIINPELEAANEIRRLIMFPLAMKIDTFAQGRIELIELKVSKCNQLYHLQLSSLPKITKASVLICVVQRDDDVIIPDGHFELLEDDHIYVTGSHKDLLRFCVDLGFLSHKVKNVTMIGGSKIAYYLAKQLSVQGIQTKIIERNHERCLELSQKIPYSTIIEADGSDQDILFEEGVERSDAVVCLTGLDEENIILSIFTKKLGAKKTIAKVNRMKLNRIVDKMEVDGIVDPKSIVASQIIGYLRAKANNDDSTSVQTLYKIVNEEVEAVEFIVNNKTLHLSKTLTDIQLKKGILIAVILRNNQVIVPKGNDTLEINDRVIILTYRLPLHSINDIFEDSNR